MEPASKRSSMFRRFRGPFVQFTIVALIGVVAIAVGGFIASKRAGEAEAMTEVRALTNLVAKTVVQPLLDDGLMAGDPDAIAALDIAVREYVLTGTNVRVKLWDRQGRIVYSDEPQLIGETYELEEDQLESLFSGSVVSEISSLTGPENRFEVDQGRLLEVYLPLVGPDGQPLLYESYFAMSQVTDASGRIRSEFAPIIIGSLGLMFLMHLLLAWGLNRRLHRGQLERERLLHRAIESSDLERRRIAADLHDGVVQDLVATSFAVAAAAESAAQSSSALTADLQTASVGAHRSLQSLRSLLVDIYPPNLKTQGLESALNDLLAPVSSLGIETTLDIVGEESVGEPETELIYRVAREATRNVLRHADASNVYVTVDASNDAVVATISDDGKGFRQATNMAPGHLGLRVLSDLAADAHARLMINSAPGEGTTLTLEVPR
jgi:two-component system NarL family sensor kinase